MHPVPGVGRVGGRPQPHVVIEARRHRLRSRVARPARLLGQDDFDALEFADSTVAHQLGHAVVLHHRAVLGAGLEDFVMLAHGRNEHFPLVDRHSWFLALHVLAGLDG